MRRAFILASLLIVPVAMAGAESDTGTDAPNEWANPRAVSAGVITGSVDAVDDEDFFRITPPAGMNVRATLTATPPPGHVLFVVLYDTFCDICILGGANTDDDQIVTIAGGWPGEEVIVNVDIRRTGNAQATRGANYSLTLEFVQLPKFEVLALTAAAETDPSCDNVPGPTLQRAVATVRNVGPVGGHLTMAFVASGDVWTIVEPYVAAGETRQVHTTLDTCAVFGRVDLEAYELWAEEAEHDGPQIEFATSFSHFDAPTAIVLPGEVEPLLRN